nr:reverse transcriptase [Tanacetum cinerariifolium]
ELSELLLMVCEWLVSKVIRVAIAKGFRNVILKIDSNILVGAFLHNKELICCSFTSCSWSFVRREGNRVAHELARRALCDNVDEVYDGFVPPLVDSWVLNDLMYL